MNYALAQTGTTHYHAQIELTDKGHSIKGFVVFGPAKRAFPILSSQVLIASSDRNQESK